MEADLIDVNRSANAAAATTSPASTGAATSVTAGLGLLGAGLIFALAA